MSQATEFQLDIAEWPAISSLIPINSYHHGNNSLKVNKKLKVGNQTRLTPHPQF